MPFVVASPRTFAKSSWLQRRNMIRLSERALPQRCRQVYSDTRRVQRFPQIGAPLHAQPKLRTVAEDAGEDERGRGGHRPTIVTEFVDMLAGDAHCLRERR